MHGACRFFMTTTFRRSDMHDRNSEGFSTITPEEARAMVNNPRLISGPPTLVKQDVTVSSPKAMWERECSLAVAEGRTNLSELARLNSENEARLERGKTTAKSLPDPHPFPRSCGVRSSRFSSCERPIHQSLRAVGVHLLNSMPTMNYRKPSVPDNA